MLSENSSSSLKCSNQQQHPVVAQSAASSSTVDGIGGVVPLSSSGTTSGTANNTGSSMTKGLTRSNQDTLPLSSKYREESGQMIQIFDTWMESEQTEFIESLLSKMSHCQHSQINSYLKPMLQRDFISLLPSKFHYLIKRSDPDYCYLISYLINTVSNEYQLILISN